MRNYRALGQPFGAPLSRCIAAHARLTRRFDPRHRPPDEQPLWLAYQDELDESLALIYDVARMGVGA